MQAEMRVSRDEDVRRSHARDASGLTLLPDAVARPTTRDELLDVFREAVSAPVPVTPAGGHTSTTAASICDRGLILSTRALDRIIDVDPERRIAHVEPGVLIGDLQRALAAHGLFFAPDPTSENESTVGGAIACNASGPRTLRYGATRRHVEALTVALANGEVLEIRRPQLEKNTVGYTPAQDLVDWFVGSEGSLGVILSAELRLLPRPAHEVGIAIPFASEAAALRFVLAARASADLNPRCLEYFDSTAADLALNAVGDAASPWPRGTVAVVYAEHAGPEAAPLDQWLEAAEFAEARTDDVSVFEGDSALVTARKLRHAVPAGMHERVAPFLGQGGRRVSTDWAVPFPRLIEAVAMARRQSSEAGIAEPVVYGHAGNGHPHCNFVARDPDEVRRIEAVVEGTLREVLAMGGTVAAEHGIGKLKSRWLPLQMSATQQRLMRAIKHELDPQGLLAPGNILR